MCVRFEVLGIQLLICVGLKAVIAEKYCSCKKKHYSANAKYIIPKLLILFRRYDIIVKKRRVKHAK